MQLHNIGIFNNKGGVAKTTSVINLAYFMQKAGRKVLVVDCDTQENCFSFFLTSQVPDAILRTAYENIALTTWERFQRIPDGIRERFDYILFDLPPTMSDEVREIIRLCDRIYVPTILGEFEIAGLKRVTDEIYKQGVKLGGVFVTMYQQRNDAELIGEFRTVLQDRLMQTVIPYSKSVRESQKAGLPIEAYFIDRAVPHSKTAWKIVDAYEMLTSEIMWGEYIEERSGNDRSV